MFNKENFEKVMKLENSYEAISKHSKNVFGYGGIRSATSFLVVFKLKTPDPPYTETGEYYITIGIKNEWDKIYRELGYYTYYIRKEGVYYLDWNDEEVELKQYIPIPSYFDEEMENHFLQILEYLKKKVSIK